MSSQSCEFGFFKLVKATGEKGLMKIWRILRKCVVGQGHNGEEVCHPQPGAMHGGSIPKFVAATGVLWLVVVATAFAAISIYSNTPGIAGNAPVNWPSASRIPLDSKIPTLVTFIHPQCPCGHASLGELERLLSDCQGLARAYVVLIKPEGAGTGWTNTGVCREAYAIPGIKVLVDVAEVETGLFGSETSGDVVLYGVQGELMFHGGITASRGHSGDNQGRDTLGYLLKTAATTQPHVAMSAPVYGCKLTSLDDLKGGALCTPR